MERVKSNILKAIVEANRGTHIMLVFWLKDTKIDSHQFMDLNTHQNTKMQTLALSNIDHKT
ncbi:hypothetical protein VN0682_02730 [Helicobacter pylori]|nr:hypothetical protein VN0682_02730 [Helicobacter pylori]